MPKYTRKRKSACALASEATAVEMERVVRVARAMYWSDELECEINYPSGITVIEVGETQEPTGLVDEHGHDICRVKDPIGFVYHEE